MTKEITKARIIQEIQDKFKLREMIPEVFAFSETVVPIYDIEQHLTIWETKQSTVSITSASAFVFFVVPQNEKWRLRRYNFVFYNEGAYKVSGLYILRGASDFLYMDLEKGQTTSYIVQLSQDVILYPGNQVKVLIDTYVSTANLAVKMDVQVEEIR